MSVKHDIVALTGLPGVGKTTVASYLCKNHGYLVMDIGDLLSRQLFKAGIRCNNRSEIGPRFLDRFGDQEIFELIRASHTEGLFVMDAIRLPQTIRRLLSWKPTMQVWHVRSSEESRMNWLRERLHSQELTGHAMSKRVELYSRYDKSDPENRAMAHHELHNDKTLPELIEQVHSCLAADFKAD